MRKWFSEKKPEDTHSLWAIKKINPVDTFTFGGEGNGPAAITKWL
ncbi:hypothetical protein [Peribacillus simplex]|nr:hypothetical protein [Peribacillus simplex]